MRLDEESSTGSQPTSSTYRHCIQISHHNQTDLEFNGLFYFLQSFLATYLIMSTFSRIYNLTYPIVVYTEQVRFSHSPQVTKNVMNCCPISDWKTKFICICFLFPPKAKVYLVYHGHRTLTFVQSVRHNIRGKSGEMHPIAHAQLQMKFHFSSSARFVTSVTVVVDRFIQQIKEVPNSRKLTQTFRLSWTARKVPSRRSSSRRF